VECGKQQMDELKPLCQKLSKQLNEIGPHGLVISKDKLEELKNRSRDYDNMSTQEIEQLKCVICETQPHMFDKLSTMSDIEFKSMMKINDKSKNFKKKLDDLEKEDPEAFIQALHIKMQETMRKEKVTQDLSDSDLQTIKELSNNFGFPEDKVKEAYLVCDKNPDFTVNMLLGN
jgi:hypothetical protein